MASIYYVDAYNIMHQSPRIAPMLRTDFEAARETLIDKVACFCIETGNRVCLVFDGRGQHQPEHVQHNRGVASLQVVYTPSGQTADAYIERQIYRMNHRLNAVAVSNDRSLRDLCRNMGSLTMEAGNFLNTLREAQADTSRTVANTLRHTTLGHLENQLSPENLAHLAALREKLK